VAKAKLGLVPQELALYEELSATQNLTYFAALYGIRGKLAEERVQWALGVVGLADRAKDVVKTYSGGMQRRLNIAAGLVHKPELLILDEPTVGVDPQSRNHIFETVRTLRTSGITVIYTSHYMEEVEALCDRVAIMDGGDIVALGTVSELVATYAGRGIELELAGDVDAGVAAAAAHATVTREGKIVRVEPTAGLAPVIAAIEDSGATIARIESRQASLETAFLALTGRALRDGAA
jgi:ABC-2 type transport system ATP-binding protein